ncbi:urease accessory UreF family protein [Mesorhizobium sp. BAC0120]|nr:urease accessory UreF family protein [Mesorhizobium sp. BAC0120]MDW6024628.1 urease accessory UreF family protein [Mesorhizobium sp. BAC0120]
MTEPPSTNGLLKLTAWLSPAFPIGSFSYSHGLESAVSAMPSEAPSTAFRGLPPPLRRGGSQAAGGRDIDPPPFTGEGDHAERGGGGERAPLITSADELKDWLAALLRFGSAWNDAVLFAAAWRRQQDSGDMGELADLGAALAGSFERHLETTLQGRAFAAALQNGWPQPAVELPDPCPYPIAVGAAAGAHGIPLEDALPVWLQAFVTNLAQAAIRLGITGQAGAVGLVAALEPVIAETATCAAGSTLDDLGSATVLSEIMSMRHETQYSRLFRT